MNIEDFENQFTGLQDTQKGVKGKPQAKKFCEAPQKSFRACSQDSDDVFGLSSGENNMAFMSTADDLNGSPDDLLNDKILRDFDYNHKFTEEDVLDLPVLQFGKVIRLKAYRYPPKNYRKAVIFYIHGYGSYAQATGALAKYLADFDFEVFAIDQRGFGESEGQRGIVEKKEDVYNDQWLLIYEAIRKYKIDQQKTPLFLFGRSFGGLIATNMASSVVSKSMFTGVCLLTPYYRCWTEKLYSYQPILKACKFFNPHKIIPSEFQELEPEYEAKWGHIEHDVKCQGFFTVTTGVLWAEEQVIARDNIQDIDLPMLFIEADGDTVVRNDHILEYFHLANKRVEADRLKKSKLPNKYLKISNCNHTTVCYEKEAACTLIREIVLYFNKLIDEKARNKKLF